MTEKRIESEMSFGEAFAQAAGLPMPGSAESGGDARVSEPDQPETSGDEASRDAFGEDASKDFDVEAAAGDTPDAEPDFRQLYERERQRLRSFQGRYRKDKERWLAERDALLEELARVGGAAAKAKADPSGPSDKSGQSGQDGEPGDAGLMSADSPLADNPELAKAVCSMVRATVEELAKPVLASLEIERHLRRIAAAHPDWEELAAGPELSDWIEAQPAYLAASLRRVVENGSADEVVDLLDRFKREQGRTPFAGQAALSQARREREAERAAAVPSRSAGPARGRPDKSDFRSAWSEAASIR